MTLPISKSALDRLGVRLTDSDAVSDDDLAELERVVGAYQDVLNGAKIKLTELGYRATTRMKTTGTLVDKLRRETARLSQVQDLAGARIIVPDRFAQDAAADRIRDVFESTGCAWRVIDRRTNPSHGYRAVHLIVQVDRVPVEIQIRTDLQDSWAQIVERLADVWGRGIRYGGEPAAPDSVVGSGAMTRRDMVSMLMRFSDIIARFEELQVSFMKAAEHSMQSQRIVETLKVPSGAGHLIVEEKMPEDLVPAFDEAIRKIQDVSSEAGSLLTGWRRMSLDQLAEAARSAARLARQYLEEQEAELRSMDVRLRDTLTELADAIGLG